MPNENEKVTEKMMQEPKTEVKNNAKRESDPGNMQPKTRKEGPESITFKNFNNLKMTINDDEISLIIGFQKENKKRRIRSF